MRALPLVVLLLAGCTVSTGSSPQSDPAPTAPPPVRTISIDRSSWEFRGRAGQLLETEHYRLHTTANNPVLVGRASRFMELALDHYRTAITDLPEPTGQMDTYIFADRPEWVRGTVGLLGDRARPFLEIRRGGFATGGTGMLWDIGVQDTLAIAAHEGWHQYTQTVFRERLPTVLEEAIAVYMEGFRWDGPSRRTPSFQPWANVERFDNLRRAAETNSLMSLQTLLSTAPGDLVSRVDNAVITYYAQGWALIHFLREAEDGRYRDGLERLLQDAASGRMRERVGRSIGSWGNRPVLNAPGPAVFAAYFGPELSRIDAEFQRFLDRITAPGAKTQIAIGQNPLD